MAGENIVQVGAVFTGAELQSAIDEATATVRADLDKMQMSFEELKASSTAALTQLEAKVAELQAQLAETATEGAASMKELSGSIVEAATAGTGAMAGFAAIFGAGIFVAAIDHLKEQALEIEHLSAATGIAVPALTELKAAMDDLGVSSDRLPQQLTRLARAIEEAAQGSQKQIDAFHNLGISTEGWAQKLPDPVELLGQLADHLENSTNKTRDLAEMSALFGRNVTGLVAILGGGREALNRYMEAHKDLGAAMEKATPAARELQQAEADIKAGLETALLPVLRLAVPVIRSFIAEWYVLRDVWVSLKIGAVELAQELVATFEFQKKALSHPFDFAAIEKDTAEYQRRIDSVANAAAAEVRKLGDDIKQQWADLWKSAPLPPSPLGGDDQGAGAGIAKVTQNVTTLHFHMSKVAELQKRINEAQMSGAVEAIFALDAIWNKLFQDGKKGHEELIRSADSQAQLEVASAQKSLEQQEAAIQHALATHKITKAQEIQQVADAKAKELELEIQYWKDVQLLMDKGSDEWNKVQTKITEIQKQQIKVRADAEVQAANANDSRLIKQLQEWLDIHKQMQNAYLQGLNQMNSALMNFVTTGKFNWQSLGSSIIQEIGRVWLQWLEAQLMMKVFGMETAATTGAANIASSAAQGAAAAGASVAAIPVVGWTMVDEVAAATYASLLTYEAGIAAFKLGGVVPATGMILAHEGERVLPASMSGDGDLGGAGSTFNITHTNNVTATDHRDAYRRMQRDALRDQRRFLRKLGF